MSLLCSSHTWVGAMLVCSLCTSCRPSEIQLRLRSDARANGCRSVVLLVRKVEDAASYRRDRYSELERLVITQDASVLRVLTVPPGLSRPQTFKIPYLTHGHLALYALYGTAMADWRVLFLAPVPDRIDLTLGSEGIDRSQTRAHRPRRLPKLPESLPSVPTVATPALSKNPTIKPAGGASP